MIDITRFWMGLVFFRNRLHWCNEETPDWDRKYRVLTSFKYTFVFKVEFLGMLYIDISVKVLSFYVCLVYIFKPHLLSWTDCCNLVCASNVSMTNSLVCRNYKLFFFAFYPVQWILRLIVYYHFQVVLFLRWIFLWENLVQGDLFLIEECKFISVM